MSIEGEFHTHRVINKPRDKSQTELEVSTVDGTQQGVRMVKVVEGAEAVRVCVHPLGQEVVWKVVERNWLRRSLSVCSGRVMCVWTEFFVCVRPAHAVIT